MIKLAHFHLRGYICLGCHNYTDKLVLIVPNASPKYVSTAGLNICSPYLNSATHLTINMYLRLGDIRGYHLSLIKRCPRVYNSPIKNVIYTTVSAFSDEILV